MAQFSQQEQNQLRLDAARRYRLSISHPVIIRQIRDRDRPICHPI